MASSYSTDLKLELMVTGENAGTWGDITNTNLNNLCLGIDFGTTNSVISYLNDNENIEYIMEPNTGEILIPSTIYFLNENIMLFT